MLNILGEEGKSGPVVYEGVKEVLNTPGAHLHLYGKHETRPFRKMGHLTVCHDDLETAISLAKALQIKFKATSEQ
jgi:5-(carboxyamino)imidazole ribonucleotide synthase